MKTNLEGDREMSTTIRALLCLLAIQVFVFADITGNTPIDSNGSSGSGIGPAKDTLNNEGAGSSSYGKTGGEADTYGGTEVGPSDYGSTGGVIVDATGDGTNTNLNPGNYENTSNEYFSILLEIHRENDRLEKITIILYKIIALLSLIMLEIILSVLFIKKDEKFVKEWAPSFTVVSIMIFVFIIFT